MRKFATVAPQFWIGRTGKAIRDAGKDARILATYLITSPTSNMIGLYYLPVPTIAHETGLTADEIRLAFRTLEEIAFCWYDQPTEMVWIPAMARYQIGERLGHGDKRITGIGRELRNLPANPFVGAFHREYGESFNLPAASADDQDKGIDVGDAAAEGPSEALRSPLEGAYKPLRRGPVPAPVPVLDHGQEGGVGGEKGGGSVSQAARVAAIRESMQVGFGGFFQNCLGNGGEKWLTSLVVHFREPDYPADQIERGLESMHRKFSAKGLAPPTRRNARLQVWEWIERETVKRQKTIEEEIDEYYAKNRQPIPD